MCFPLDKSCTSLGVLVCQVNTMKREKYKRLVGIQQGNGYDAEL